MFKMLTGDQNFKLDYLFNVSVGVKLFCSNLKVEYKKRLIAQVCDALPVVRYQFPQCV